MVESIVITWTSTWMSKPLMATFQLIYAINFISHVLVQLISVHLIIAASVMMVFKPKPS